MTGIKRFVFDTNVLVSAVLLPGGAASLAYTMALDYGVFVVSPDLMWEYETVLMRPKFDRYVSIKSRRTFLDALYDSVVWIEATSRITDCRDPKDNMILELAIDAYASAIITGDQDLLALHPYHNIPIIAPGHLANPTKPIAFSP
jgi:putative PIN family toxin of toxin-antitoxin system